MAKIKDLIQLDLSEDIKDVIDLEDRSEKELKYEIENYQVTPKISIYLTQFINLYHSNIRGNQEKSIQLLLEYVKKDEFPIDAWHYLGLNYGKLKKLDYSSYAFAEKYMLIGKIENAKIHLDKATKITKDPMLKKKLLDLKYEMKKKKK